MGLTSGSNNTTSSNNTVLGYRAGPTTGSLTNAAALGYQAEVSQSNSLVLGGTGPNAVNVGIGTSAPGQRLDVAGGNIRITGTAGTDGLIFPDGTKQTTANASDNLGNHTATTNLTLGANSIVGDGVVRIAPQYNAGEGGQLMLRGSQQANRDLSIDNVNGRFRILSNNGTGTELERLSIGQNGVVTINGNLNVTGLKAVNYAQLAPVLVAALQELRAENAAFRPGCVIFCRR